MTNPTHGIAFVKFTPTELARFWTKFEKTDGCWNWLPALNSSGYGTFAFGYRQTVSAHRAAYMITKGEIPAGMVMDHLCRNRRCVNPDHLEPVTASENVRRSPLLYRSHCLSGHEYTSATTRVASDGARICRQCRLDQGRARRERIKAG